MLYLSDSLRGLVTAGVRIGRGLVRFGGAPRLVGLQQMLCYPMSSDCHAWLYECMLYLSDSLRGLNTAGVCIGRGLAWGSGSGGARGSMASTTAIVSHYMRVVSILL